MPSKDDKDLAAADDSMKTHKPTNTRNHPGALRRDILQVAEHTRPRLWSGRTTRPELEALVAPHSQDWQLHQLVALRTGCLIRTAHVALEATVFGGEHIHVACRACPIARAFVDARALGLRRTALVARRLRAETHGAT